MLSGRSYSVRAGLCLLFLFLMNNAAVEAKEIRIGGGAAPLNNILKRVQAVFEKKSGHTLILSEEGPDLALIHLDEGKLDAATAGVPFEEWLKLIDAKGKSLQHRDELKHRTIGRDLIQVYANQDVGLESLDREQLSRIFSGAVKSWSEVGGPNAPIQVVMGSKITGTNALFRKEVLGGAEYSRSALWTDTAPDIIRMLGKTPHSVGLGPIGVDLKGFQVKALKGPEVGRPILLATRGVPSDAVAELLKFIESPEGRALIKR